jgi:hypothetical protein
MGYERWTQYVHYYHPNIALASAKEDVCDGCFAINTELLNPSISEERKEELNLLKTTHIQDAIIQRRAVQAFVKQVMKNLNPGQVLPELMLPDYIDSELCINFE